MIKKSTVDVYARIPTKAFRLAQQLVPAYGSLSEVIRTAMAVYHRLLTEQSQLVELYMSKQDCSCLKPNAREFRNKVDIHVRIDKQTINTIKRSLVMYGRVSDYITDAIIYTYPILKNKLDTALILSNNDINSVVIKYVMDEMEMTRKITQSVIQVLKELGLPIDDRAINVYINKLLYIYKPRNVEINNITVKLTKSEEHIVLSYLDRAHAVLSNILREFRNNNKAITWQRELFLRKLYDEGTKLLHKLERRYRVNPDDANNELLQLLSDTIDTIAYVLENKDDKEKVTNAIMRILNKTQQE